MRDMWLKLLLSNVRNEKSLVNTRDNRFTSWGALRECLTTALKALNFQINLSEYVLSMITTNNISALHGASLKAKFERLIFYNIL